jgi:hypothetical protein
MQLSHPVGVIGHTASGRVRLFFPSSDSPYKIHTTNACSFRRLVSYFTSETIKPEYLFMAPPFYYLCCPFSSHSRFLDLKNTEILTLHLIGIEKEIVELKNKK